VSARAPISPENHPSWRRPAVFDRRPRVSRAPGSRESHCADRRGKGLGPARTREVGDAPEAAGPMAEAIAPDIDRCAGVVGARRELFSRFAVYGLSGAEMRLC